MLNKLIKYFVYATKGNITKTQLIKFLYLADLYSVKWTGNQLTGKPVGKGNVVIPAWSCA